MPSMIALFAAPWTNLEVDDEEQMRFARLAFAALRSKARAMNVIGRLGETELHRLLPLLTEEEAPRRRRFATSAHVYGDEPLGARSIVPASLHVRARPIAFAALQQSGHAAASVSADGITSDWAGLFFVLNLLPHAGGPPTAPRDTIATLHAVATWLRIRPDEPIYEALAALNDDELRPDVPPATVRALRMACVAVTRRPLRRIVARPGLIRITRTHLTTVFDLKSVRLDVRKAGLDLDPGWLPRLGRVVRFEYE